MAKRYCPDCGTPLEQGDVFCKECGARVLEEEKSELQHVIPKEEPVQPAPEETISAKQNASKKRNLIIAVIAGILVAGGIGAAIAINAGRKPESPELSVDTETNKLAEFSEIITETETEKKTEKPVETTQPPTEAETEPPTTEPKGTDYVAAYGGLVDATCRKWGSDSSDYYLFDLDGDGVLELLIDEGISLVDSICTIYTVVDGTAQECGVIGGTMTGELSTDNGGLYYTKFIQGFQVTDRIEKNGTAIESVHVLDVEVYDDYASYGTPIEGCTMFSQRLLQDASGWTDEEIQSHEADQKQNVQTSCTLKACPAGFGIIYTQETGVNMRSNPDMYADNVLTQIPKNERVNVVSEVDGWFEVEYAGMTGYVYGEYLARGISPSSSCAAYYIGSTVDDVVWGLGAEEKIPDSYGYVSTYSPYSNYVVVPVDGNDHLISFISVSDGGCVIDDVYVGMTYEEMKNVLNLNGITVVEDWQGDYYTATFPIYWNGNFAEIVLDFDGAYTFSVCTGAILR